MWCGVVLCGPVGPLQKLFCSTLVEGQRRREDGVHSYLCLLLFAFQTMVLEQLEPVPSGVPSLPVACPC